MSCAGNDETPTPVNTAESAEDGDAEIKEESPPSDISLNTPMAEDTGLSAPLQEEQANVKVCFSITSLFSVRIKCTFYVDFILVLVPSLESYIFHISFSEL